MIGIIAAEPVEMQAIKEKMKDVEKEKIYNLEFYKGKIQEKESVLVTCGVGKVNSARTTQILIDNYKVDYVINVGSSGGINSELNIGDIVIAKDLVQYDFDITGVGDYEKGEICGIGKYIETDKKLTNLCEKTIKEIKIEDSNIKIGTIASADYFAVDSKKMEWVRQEFNAECVEMEGAAIAQVCFLDNVPFIIIRGISDVQNGNNKIDFHTYIEKASKKVAIILENLIIKM